jgi:hypothetical protein
LGDEGLDPAGSKQRTQGGQPMRHQRHQVSRGAAKLRQALGNGKGVTKNLGRTREFSIRHAQGRARNVHQKPKSAKRLSLCKWYEDKD